MKTPCKEPSPYDTLTEQRLAPLKQKLFPGHDGLNGGNYHALFMVLWQIVGLGHGACTRNSSNPKLDMPQVFNKPLTQLLNGCYC